MNEHLDAFSKLSDYYIKNIAATRINIPMPKF